jgi:hypothetical protein
VQRDDEVRQQHLDHARWRDPSGKRDPRVCLRTGMSSKTPLYDVEKRDVKIRERKLCYYLLLGELCKEQNIY